MDDISWEYLGILLLFDAWKYHKECAGNVYLSIEKLPMVFSVSFLEFLSSSSLFADHDALLLG